ncbi:hypothetical protein AB0J08_41395, partial [Kitasatospora sp. NPDC050463]
MRTRITTLVLSGLASAALAWGAGGTAYASPPVDHSAAAEAAGVHGEWVDSLLRLAQEDTGSAAGAWAFTGRSTLYSTPVVRPAHRADSDSEAGEDSVDSSEPDLAEPAEAVAAEQEDSVQSGEGSSERGRPMVKSPELVLPEGSSAGGGEHCHEGGHGHPGDHGSSDCVCPHGDHGDH